MLKLNLIVIRAENPAASAQWYSEIFGLEFIPEKHDDGVLHYSSRICDGLIEIYPSHQTTSKITFGFSLSKFDFDQIAPQVKHKIIGENLLLMKDRDGNSIILSFSE